MRRRCLVILVARLVKGRQAVDPQRLAWTGLRFAFNRFLDELLGAFFVVHVRHRHAPIRHGALRIEGPDLAERSLGLEVPESMQLPDPLIEQGLHAGHGTGHRQVHLAGPRHQIGGLARPLVEDFAMRGMPRQRLLAKNLGRLAKKGSDAFSSIGRRSRRGDCRRFRLLGCFRFRRDVFGIVAAHGGRATGQICPPRPRALLPKFAGW